MEANMSGVHNDIGLPLELKLRTEFGFDERPAGTVFDADGIVNGFFYEAMNLLLVKKKIEKIKRNDFLYKYSHLANKTLSEIGVEEAVRIYDEFLKLLK